MLRTVLGLVEPDVGTEVDVMAVDRAPRGEIRRRAGFVIQDGVFPHHRRGTRPFLRPRTLAVRSDLGDW